MHAKLVLVGGKANRNEIRLKLPSIVGRGRDVGVVISHPTVSRQHCEIFAEGDELRVRDLGSLNGTLVDGDQIQVAKLKHGGMLTVGPLTFQAVYEHLGDLPSPPVSIPAKVEAKTVATPLAAAQTVVDSPRADAGQQLRFDPPQPGLSETVLSVAEDTATPALDLPTPEEDEMEFELSTDEALRTVVETPLPAAADDDEEFTLTASAQVDETLAFSLDDESISAPPVAAVADPAVEEASTSNQSDDLDEFLAGELGGPARVDVEATIDEVTVTEFNEVKPADDEPAPRAAEMEAGEPDLDWLAPDATELKSADAAEFSATLDAARAAEQATDAAVDELVFDEEMLQEEGATSAEVGASAPEDVAPPSESEPQTRKRRGLWPFGRKKDKEPVTNSGIAPAPSSHPPEAAAHMETVASESWELADAPPVDVGEQEAVTLDLDSTQELSHEHTVELDLPVAVPDAVDDVTPPLQVEQRKKKGLFSFGRKAKDSTPVVEAPTTAAVSAPVEDITVLNASEGTVDEAAPASEPADSANGPVEINTASAPSTQKKRGWWPFGKRGKESSPPAATKAETGTGAGAPGETPTPESFEFSEAELLEMTAEVVPPASAPADPQQLTDDEVLDFELDLPEDGPSPAPADPGPPMATAADDDDFLDFLAEELPQAATKPKPSGK